MEDGDCPCGSVLSAEYPVCVVNDANWHFDIPSNYAADLASFLMTRRLGQDDDMYFKTRQGTCRAIWMPFTCSTPFPHVLLAGSWLATVRLSKGDAKELGALIASVLRAGRSRQPDQLAGARARAHKNLRSVFT